MVTEFLMTLSPLAIGLLILGILLILYGATKFFMPSPISLGARGIIAVIGIIFLVGAFALAPASQTVSSAPPQQIVPLQPEISFNHIVGANYSQATNTFTVAIKNFNTSTLKFGAPTNGVFSFDATLNSLSVNTTFPTVTVGGNLAISNTTKASDNSYLFTEYSNNTMEVDVATPNGVTHNDISYQGATYLVPLKAASSANVNFTFTLSGQGIANLNSQGPGATSTYTFSIGSQTYTVNVIVLTTIS